MSCPLVKSLAVVTGTPTSYHRTRRAGPGLWAPPDQKWRTWSSTNDTRHGCGGLNLVFVNVVVSVGGRGQEPPTGGRRSTARTNLGNLVRDEPARSPTLGGDASKWRSTASTTVQKGAAHHPGVGPVVSASA